MEHAATQPDPDAEKHGVAPLTPPGASPATDPLLGRIIGSRFKLIRVLGVGGMGRVYLAEDQKLNGRLVALKLMMAVLSGHGELRTRFQREAILQANLRHGQIIQILDIGECTDGLYIVMEYSEGRSLSHLIRQLAPLPTERALSIAEQILEVLDFAHRQDVAHRDLKPSNILVEERGGRDYVRILDFGIAKMLRKGSSPEGATLTQSGHSVGTLGYMPPEQAMGEIEKLDHRADIYAVGIVLHELLTGRVPTPREHRTDPVRYALYVMQNPVGSLRGAFPSLKIPSAVDGLVLGALHRKPEERYPSALAFINEIQAVRTGLPATRPGGRVDSIPADASTHLLEKPASRPTPARAGWITAVLAIVLAGLIFADRHRAVRELDVLETQLGSVTAALAAAEANGGDSEAPKLRKERDELSSSLVSAKAESESRRKTVSEEIDRRTKAETALDAARGEAERALQARDDAKTRAENAEKSSRDFESQVRTLTRTLAERDNELADKVKDLASAGQRAENAEKARDTWEQKYNNAIQNKGGEDPEKTQLKDDLASKDRQLSEKSRTIEEQKTTIDRQKAELEGYRNNPRPVDPNPSRAGRKLTLKNAASTPIKIDEVTASAGGTDRKVPVPEPSKIAAGRSLPTLDLPDDTSSVTVRYAIEDRFKRDFGPSKTVQIPVGSTETLHELK